VGIGQAGHGGKSLAILASFTGTGAVHSLLYLFSCESVCLQLQICNNLIAIYRIWLLLIAKS